MLDMIELDISTRVFVESDTVWPAAITCRCTIPVAERPDRDEFLQEEYEAWFKEQPMQSDGVSTEQQRIHWWHTPAGEAAELSYREIRYRDREKCREQRNAVPYGILWDFAFSTAFYGPKTEDVTDIFTMLSGNGLVFLPPSMSALLMHDDMVEGQRFVVGLEESVERIEAGGIAEAATICTGTCSAGATRRHAIKSFVAAFHLGALKKRPLLNWWIIRQDGIRDRPWGSEDPEDGAETDLEADSESEAEDVRDSDIFWDNEAACCVKDETYTEEDSMDEGEIAGEKGEDSADPREERLVERERQLKEMEDLLKAHETSLKEREQEHKDRV